MIARVGEKAEIKLPIYPHMLRHSTEFKLANDGKIPEVFSIIWGKRTSNIRFDIQKFHRLNSKNSLMIEGVK